jgi:anthranilate synthase component 2
MVQGISVLILDNYDSFTYNLVHLLEALEVRCVVRKNDAISLEEVSDFDKIVLSPGPGLPKEAGILLPLIQRFASTKSILGVCLGHQAIGQVFGAELYNVGNVVHGKSRSTRIVAEDVLFTGIEFEFQSARYHSWALRNVKLPLVVTAEDDNGLVMAVRHETYNVRGVQFHPESIMTPDGFKIIQNWLING